MPLQVMNAHSCLRQQVLAKGSANKPLLCAQAKLQPSDVLLSWCRITCADVAMVCVHHFTAPVCPTGAYLETATAGSG